LLLREYQEYCDGPVPDSPFSAIWRREIPRNARAPGNSDLPALVVATLLIFEGGQ